MSTSSNSNIEALIKILQDDPALAQALKKHLNGQNDNTQTATIPIASNYIFRDIVKDAERYINDLKQIDYHIMPSLNYEYAFTTIADQLKVQPVLRNLFTSSRLTKIKGSDWEIRQSRPEEDHVLCYNSCEHLLKTYLIHNVISQVNEYGTNIKSISQFSIPEIIRDIKNSQSRESALAIADNEVKNSNKMLHLSTLRTRFENVEMRMKDFETMLPYFKNPYRVMYVPREIFPSIQELHLEKPFLKMIQTHIKEEKDIDITDFTRVINEKNLDKATTLQYRGQISTYAANTILDFKETNVYSSHSTSITQKFGLSYKDTAYDSLHKAANTHSGPAMTAQGVRSSNKIPTIGNICPNSAAISQI